EAQFALIRFGLIMRPRLAMSQKEKVEKRVLGNIIKVGEDSLILATAAGGTVRCIATVTTDLVAEAARRHVTSPTVTAALGRTLTGTLLLATSLKELDRLTVQTVSDGPIGGITAEPNARAEARGSVPNPDAGVPL